MTTRPPRSGGPKGRKPQAGKFDAGKFRGGKAQADGRARTGPRTSARDAAERAARNRGEDAGTRDPWGSQGAAVSAPARPPKP
ncbi:RluA family pseudouridine synthase, partial [Methylobacterium organophilum]|nr:RluA family pseudouridine synthase [Methylobacterium organophilum]